MNYAFQYCSVLETLTIVEGLETIGDYALQYCSLLQNITIPSSVTSIGSNPLDHTRVFSSSMSLVEA